jgi:gas vesicle protein
VRDESACLVAFLLGGIAGASVALMLTPRSGRETRELLGARLRQGERTARRRLERGVEAFERLRDEVSGASETPLAAQRVVFETQRADREHEP